MASVSGYDIDVKVGGVMRFHVHPIAIPEITIRKFVTLEGAHTFIQGLEYMAEKHNLEGWTQLPDRDNENGGSAYKFENDEGEALYTNTYLTLLEYDYTLLYNIHSDNWWVYSEDHETLFGAFLNVQAVRIEAHFADLFKEE